MITITPDNQIDRDGEIIGSIIGGIAWMKAKPAPRIVGQIRQIAGIDGLKFEVADAPPHQPISAAAGVDNGSGPEPAPVSDDAVAGISFHVPADWGTPGTAYFSRCFVNHHGNDAYSAYCKANGI